MAGDAACDDLRHMRLAFALLPNHVVKCGGVGTMNEPGLVAGHVSKIDGAFNDGE